MLLKYGNHNNKTHAFIVYETQKDESYLKCDSTFPKSAS